MVNFGSFFGGFTKDHLRRDLEDKLGSGAEAVP